MKNFQGCPHVIRWDLLAEALSFYKDKGYQYIETPWIVDPVSNKVTRPPDVEDNLTFASGELVGSGEQGFIQLMLQGDLPPGKYCTLTPCFREEPTIDNLHQNYFMKLELIHVGASGKKSTLDMISDAFQFFEKRTSEIQLLAFENLEWDIEIKGVEVGSYGSRSHKEHTWVYGTGLAEPRYSYALSLLN